MHLLNSMNYSFRNCSFRKLIVVELLSLLHGLCNWVVGLGLTKSRKCSLDHSEGNPGHSACARYLVPVFRKGAAIISLNEWRHWV